LQKKRFLYFKHVAMTWQQVAQVLKYHHVYIECSHCVLVIRMTVHLHITYLSSIHPSNK